MIARAARRIWGDDRGQDLAEYAIALAVISVAVVFTAMFIGLINSSMWDNALQSIVAVVSGS
jgi:Flp pilus assembly pilin Flp